ncbi:MAG: PQQ-like beta-propeller repeat protein [Verrucomicrobia bacterium]|nr:PQQ-like beta-propeller repeat protein [Verrucomicrobiota bacterium]
MKILTLLFALTALLSLPASAADWPQYRGPQRNDVSAETGLLKKWPDVGPRLLWTFKNAGIGYSGPAVVGERLYTIGGRAGTESLIALDLRAIRNGTVAEVWAAAIGATFDWEGNKWSAGPSATPTVDGNLIFALGGRGDLICVEAATGRLVWKKNLPTELEAEVNPIGGGPKKLGWGFTWSPLVDGEQLICLPGGPKGTLAALNKRTGAVLWRNSEATDQAAYASPMVAEFDRVRQYVALTNKGLIGVDAKTGKLLWSYQRELPYRTEVVNSPIIQPPFVFVTVGSGHGCDLVRVTKSGTTFKAEPVYSTNKNLANHHGNVVLLGNHVYGFGEGRGWTCLEFKSGETVWAERQKFRSGAMTFADGHFYCYSESDGGVALIEATTAGWKENGRFTIPEQSASRKPAGKIWTPPVVAGGRLFLRDQEFLFCYDVAGRK